MQRGERVIGYPSDLFQGGASGPTLMDSVLLHLLAPAGVRRTRSMFRAICSSWGGECNHKNSIKIMLLWRFCHHFHDTPLIKYSFSFNVLHQLCWCVMCMAVDHRF